MTNPTIVCSYRSSCLDLPVALVGFQVEGLPLRLYHICHGGYVLLNYIDFGGAEQMICRNCVDEIRGQGKSETLNNVGGSTMYRK